ncbi:MAG: heavy-metal-associated domain-containing protein [Clostridia bacterium]|nr:heavy-metal-associated domain-containing protein [Clostridia bacterium]
MIKTTVKIDGMMCGMCEAHIADTVRRTFPEAKKVSVSRKKGEATFKTQNAVDAGVLKDAIEGTGYRFVSCASEPLGK